MMNAHIVIGLGFGDEGKGNFTNYLCTNNLNPIVVRFSGGQQAGHTVIHKGIKHVFSNFGSGTLQNIPTYFTEDCCIYLNTLEQEKEILQSKGITPQLIVHPLTKITTPYDVAYGRAREYEKKHGSCGLGIGSTMSRNENTGFKLYAIDFINVDVLKIKLFEISKYYKDLAAEKGLTKIYLQFLPSQEIVFSSLIKNSYFTIANYDYLLRFNSLIFEGSQGIMLDREHGIFPNVTYANTTSKNALKVCKQLEINSEIYYITRCYQTRHGNGWMSSTNPITICNTEEEINTVNDWQEEFKISELDYNLLNYSLKVDNIYSEGKIKNLVVTCLDQRKDFNFKYDNLYGGFNKIFNSNSPESTKIKELFID